MSRHLENAEISPNDNILKAQLNAWQIVLELSLGTVHVAPQCNLSPSVRAVISAGDKLRKFLGQYSGSGITNYTNGPNIIYPLSHELITLAANKLDC